MLADCQLSDPWPIFLKMADEYATPPYNCNIGIPAEYDWQSLLVTGLHADDEADCRFRAP